jgi:BlaI family penicillinase repressor
MRQRTVLSPLEQKVMGLLWKSGRATAADVQQAMGGGLTNATVRTLLRRLESKGYVRHSVQGRVFHYAPTVDEGGAAGVAVGGVLRRFFGGSAARLVAGLMDDGLIKPAEVQRLLRRVKRQRRP